MKARHYIAIALSLMGAAFMVVLMTLPRPLPVEECSDNYRQYKDMPGIQASYLKEYPLDDTTTIAVTMLQAQDSNVWKDIFVQIINPDNPDKCIPSDIAFRLLPKNNQTQSIDNELSDEDLVAFNKKNLTIAFFHLETMQQYLKIFDFYFTLL